jgi:hypothetical protein
MAILGNEREQGGREDFAKTRRSIEIIQRFDFISSYVGTNRFLTGMGLPGIRRIVGGQAGSKHSLGIRASATGYGCIGNGVLRVLRIEELDHGGQAIGFAGSYPPGKDLN